MGNKSTKQEEISKSGRTIYDYIENYDHWSFDQKECLDQCLIVLRKSISEGRHQASFHYDYEDNGLLIKGSVPTLKNLTSSQIRELYNTIKEYYANEFGYEIQMGNYDLG